MKRFILFFTLLILFTAFKSDKPAYRIYNSNGKAVKYKKMIKELSEAQVIFFGELHNNPINHWLELEITRNLFKIKEGKIVLGAEMFESDNQLLIDEFLSGKISKKSFDTEARLWPNYKTDYQPLLLFAKKHHLKFIATNIPRRYASVVYKNGFKGLDSLSAKAKEYIAPLPIVYNPNIKCYKDMLTQMKMMGHTNVNLPKAQAIKDATMAYYISKSAGKGKLFIHYNGAYHSENFQGIIWYLKRYNHDLKIMTISSVEQPSVDSLEQKNKGLATFILVTPNRMTKTY